MTRCYTAGMTFLRLYRRFGAWLAILALLGWAIHGGQFEDIEAEGHRILQVGEDNSQDNVERHQD